MRPFINIGLLTLLLFSCSEGGRVNSLQQPEFNNLTIDTLVYSRSIINELAGSAYREKAIGYSVIAGNDTSDFTCFVYKFKVSVSGNVGMSIRFEKATVSYEQRLQELHLILPKASKDFDFDLLTSINMGRLILSGDLAIELTKLYREQFGNSNVINGKSYKNIEQFLSNSKLALDLNKLFYPFSLEVETISVEKVFFTTKEELYKSSKVEIAFTKAPDRILDCMIGIKLSKL